MSSEELSLTWDDHHNTLVGVFEKLLETSTLVDCTIAAEGRYLKAHKIILSACSPYFELLFNQENEKNPIVVLKDIKFQELKAIIDFIYSGKVKVPEDRLGDFVDAAESLQIKGLGGDNHEKSSENDRNESPPPQRKEICMSPIPRKRRCPFVNTSEDSVSEIPSGSSVNENKNGGSISLHQIQTSILHCQTEQNSSIASTSSSSPVLPVNVQSKQSNVQTNSPVSFTEPLASPEEVLPHPERVVVKSEPEPMAEIFIPEIDFETKGEEVMEDTSVLDSGGRIAETGIGDVNSQHSANQFTAFPSATTSAARSDNVFLNVAEHTSAQDAALCLAAKEPSPKRPHITRDRMPSDSLADGEAPLQVHTTGDSSGVDVAEPARCHSVPSSLGDAACGGFDSPEAAQEQTRSSSVPCSVVGEFESKAAQQQMQTTDAPKIAPQQKQNMAASSSLSDRGTTTPKAAQPQMQTCSFGEGTTSTPKASPQQMQTRIASSSLGGGTTTPKAALQQMQTRIASSCLGGGTTTAPNAALQQILTSFASGYLGGGTTTAPKTTLQQMQAMTTSSSVGGGRMAAPKAALQQMQTRIGYSSVGGGTTSKAVLQQMQTPIASTSQSGRETPAPNATQQQTPMTGVFSVPAGPFLAKAAPHPFTCRRCGGKFSRPADFQSHACSSTPTHVCQVCKKTFPSMALLKIHAKAHVVARRFKCHVCHAGFNVVANLIQHKRTVHGLEHRP